MSILSQKKPPKKVVKANKKVVKNIVALIAAGMPTDSLSANIRKAIDNRSDTVKCIDQLCAKMVGEYLDYLVLMHSDPKAVKLFKMDAEFLAEISKLNGVDVSKYETYFVTKVREVITFINSLKKNT